MLWSVKDVSMIERDEAGGSGDPRRVQVSMYSSTWTWRVGKNGAGHLLRRVQDSTYSTVTRFTCSDGRPAGGESYITLRPDGCTSVAFRPLLPASSWHHQLMQRTRHDALRQQNTRLSVSHSTQRYHCASYRLANTSAQPKNCMSRFPSRFAYSYATPGGERKSGSVGRW